MITTQRTTPSLTQANLPGPNTITKQAALATTDARFLLMLHKAAEIGWPLAYTDDLYRHDAEALASHPGQPMLWILRDHGTHLYPLETENGHEAAYYRQVVRYWSGDHKLNAAERDNDRAHYYVVSAAELTAITAMQAQERITVRQDSVNTPPKPVS